MPQQPEKRKHSNPPIVHAEFESLTNNLRTFRVRVIQYKHDQIGLSVPMLDIRQFFKDKKNEDGSTWTGWSPNGISLNRSDLEKLFEIIPDALKEIEKVTEE